MRVALRVDASSQIGTGHLVRCLTLADALRRKGARTRFVSRHMPAHLRETLEAGGHEFALVDGAPRAGSGDALAHSHWLGTSQDADARDTMRALSGSSWDWLVVDQYSLDARWETALRATTRHILVIDDLADRAHDCDVLLDQNLYADAHTRYAGKVPGDCRLLLGPRYALLREEFLKLRQTVQPRTGRVRRALVFFGGVDTGNHTARAIEALASAGMREVEIDVVIGSQHPLRAEIESACARYGYACHVQTPRMAELMAAADIAVGAGGAATWERCCLGLPALAYPVAENQRQQVADAATAGLLYAPNPDQGPACDLARHATAFVDNSALRCAISLNGMNAVDGRGVLRTVLQLGCTDIEIREAASGDSRKLFEWRNDPAIRAASRNSGEIDWQSHQSWFASVLTDPRRTLLMGERGVVPVGVVRFDLADGEAEVSIYLVPGPAEPGTGSELLQAAERWLTRERPEVGHVRAHVLHGNEASHRLFLGCGYTPARTDYLKRLDRK